MLNAPYGTLLALYMDMQEEPMTVAVTVWEGRVSPVFDVAREVQVERTGSAGDIVCSRYPLPEGYVEEKCILLHSLGVDVLLCGAISHLALGCGHRLGLHIHPFLAGEVDTVLAAWREGRLEESSLHMPGCGCGRRRRCRFGDGFSE